MNNEDLKIETMVIETIITISIAALTAAAIVALTKPSTPKPVPQPTNVDLILLNGCEYYKPVNSLAWLVHKANCTNICHYTFALSNH